MNEEQLELFEGAREAEWRTISVEKSGAVGILSEEESEEVRRTCPKLIVDSRVVYTWKEVGCDITLSAMKEWNAKARWTVKGYQSPYLEEEFADNMLSAPTLTQVGKVCVLQTLVSFKFPLELGGVEGAFLESDDMKRELYVRRPVEGLPGLKKGQLVQCLKYVYGLNPAPCGWYGTFHKAALAIGFRRCKQDACVYILRDGHGNLVGIIGLHVDDAACGGRG